MMTKGSGTLRSLSAAARAGAGAMVLIGLAGCDGAPSAVPARSHAAGEHIQSASAYGGHYGGDGGTNSAQAASYAAPAYGGGDRQQSAPAQADTPLYKGKPIWAANRNHSAQENADYHFQRDGAAVGATSADDFIAKAHAFIDHPPKGAQVLTSSNGDKLIYDPKGNLFAVANRDGAPRTLFKPRNGQAYWDQQKQAIDSGHDYTSSPYPRRTARRAGGGDDDNG